MFALESYGINPDERFRFLAAAAANPHIHQAFYEFHTVVRDFIHSSLDSITEHFLHTRPTYAQVAHLSFPDFFTDVDVDEPRPYTDRAEHMRRRRTGVPFGNRRLTWAQRYIDTQPGHMSYDVDLRPLNELPTPGYRRNTADAPEFVVWDHNHDVPDSY